MDWPQSFGISEAVKPGLPCARAAGIARRRLSGFFYQTGDW